jgi:hypothetical protein
MSKSSKINSALGKISEANRAYRTGKEQVLEQSVNALEAQTKPLLVFLFMALTVAVWLLAFVPGIYEKLYETYGFYLIIAVFVFSYFSFFLGSKIIFKPSAEELLDDTSVFALFSACERKERRSLYSAGIALLHTVAFAFYVVDPKWLGLP